MNFVWWNWLNFPPDWRTGSRSTFERTKEAGCAGLLAYFIKEFLKTCSCSFYLIPQVICNEFARGFEVGDNRLICHIWNNILSPRFFVFSASLIFILEMKAVVYIIYTFSESWYQIKKEIKSQKEAWWKNKTWNGRAIGPHFLAVYDFNRGFHKHTKLARLTLLPTLFCHIFAVFFFIYTILC